MKRVGLFAVLAAMLLVGSANAAVLWMSDSAGNTGLDLTAGAYPGTGDMQIRLTTGALDTINIAFINAFLNTTGAGVDADSVDVIGVAGGNGDWTYDRSAFTLPADIDQTGNEYGLVSGDSDGPGYPLGSATYVHDSLTVQDTNAFGTAGTVNVVFEGAPRAAQAFGPGPTFAQYTLAPPGFPADFPNFLYVGDANSNNPAFPITVPEPAALGVLAFGGLAALRRRR